MKDLKEQLAGTSLASADFVRLFLKHERRVRAFLITLMPSANDIDDLLQDVSVLAWEKLSEFRYSRAAPDDEFVAWLCTIAKFKAYNHRRKGSRSKLVFSDELLEQLSAICVENASHLESRHAALLECLAKLSSREQEVLRRRYFGNEPVGELATWMQRSSNAVYKALNKLRFKLMRCIELRLQTEGH